jgi:hypothetical protein
MARPIKQTVEYFPHFCDTESGKTVPIMQNKFGNDGYAFWFRLLEFLGKRDGLYFDYNDPADLEFLCAKTHQNDTETVLKMLAELDLLGAIDRELYKSKVIWCQNFVNGVADAFSRSVSGVPARPSLKMVNVINSEVSVVNNSVSVAPENIYLEKATETPQRKLKEIKEEEKKEETEEDFVEWVENDCKKYYSDLDIEHELKKFNLYWSEGNRKIKRPRIAFVNWLDKAREIKNNNSNFQKQPVKNNNSDPDKYLKGKYGKMVQH